MKVLVIYDQTTGRVFRSFTGIQEALDIQPVPAGYEKVYLELETIPTTDWVFREGELVFQPEVRSLNWVQNRIQNYPPVTDQLDMLWHAMDQGTLPKVEPFYTDIKTVKETYPKP